MFKRNDQFVVVAIITVGGIKLFLILQILLITKNAPGFSIMVERKLNHACQKYKKRDKCKVRIVSAILDSYNTQAKSFHLIFT